MRAYNEYFDSITPDEGLKDRIMDSIENKAKHPRRSRLVPIISGAAAVIIICAVIPSIIHNPTPPALNGNDVIQSNEGDNTFAITLPSGSDNNEDINNTPPVGEQPGKTEYSIINSYSYGASTTPVFSPDNAACYEMPKPGAVLYFSEVSSALDSGGFDDNTLFFVGIHIFDENGQLSEDSAEVYGEMQQLKEAGYHVGFSEKLDCAYHENSDGGAEYIEEYVLFFSGLFTPEELEDFKAPDNYGYAFYFAADSDGSPVDPDVDALMGTAENTAADIAYTAAGSGFARLTSDSGTGDLLICGDWGWALDYDNDWLISASDYEIAVKIGTNDKESFIAELRERYGLTDAETEKLITGEISVACGIYFGHPDDTPEIRQLPTADSASSVGKPRFEDAVSNNEIYEICGYPRATG